jgi:RIO-like serine/threonine protein kinase
LTFCGTNLRRPDNFNVKKIVEIALQLLSRVETLHNLGYIHGDIQLKHVCLSQKKSNGQNTVFLIDFTSSQKVISQTA